MPSYCKQSRCRANIAYKYNTLQYKIKIKFRSIFPKMTALDTYVEDLAKSLSESDESSSSSSNNSAASVIHHHHSPPGWTTTPARSKRDKWSFAKAEVLARLRMPRDEDPGIKELEKSKSSSDTTLSVKSDVTAVRSSGSAPRRRPSVFALMSRKAKAGDGVVGLGAEPVLVSELQGRGVACSVCNVLISLQQPLDPEFEPEPEPEPEPEAGPGTLRPMLSRFSFVSSKRSSGKISRQSSMSEAEGLEPARPVSSWLSLSSSKRSSGRTSRQSSLNEAVSDESDDGPAGGSGPGSYRQRLSSTIKDSAKPKKKPKLKRSFSVLSKRSSGKTSRQSSTSEAVSEAESDGVDGGPAGQNGAPGSYRQRLSSTIKDSKKLLTKPKPKTSSLELDKRSSGRMSQQSSMSEAESDETDETDSGPAGNFRQRLSSTIKDSAKQLTKPKPKRDSLELWMIKHSGGTLREAP